MKTLDLTFHQTKGFYSYFLQYIFSCSTVFIFLFINLTFIWGKNISWIVYSQDGCSILWLMEITCANTFFKVNKHFKRKRNTIEKLSKTSSINDVTKLADTDKCVYITHQKQIFYIKLKLKKLQEFVHSKEKQIKI